jgi:uncharacterized protein (TIGR02246 family)
LRPAITVCAALLALLGCGQSSADNRANDEAAVRKVYEDLAAAFRVRNVDAIMRFYAPSGQVVAFDYSPPLQYQGTAGYRASYEAFFADTDGPVQMEYRDLHVMAANDLAVIYGLERIAWKSKSGAKAEMWGRCTSALRKIQGHWLIVHDHLSVPADLGTGKAAMDLRP